MYRMPYDFSYATSFLKLQADASIQQKHLAVLKQFFFQFENSNLIVFEDVICNIWYLYFDHPFSFSLVVFWLTLKKIYFRLCNQTTNVWLNSRCSRPMYEWCYRSFFHQISFNSILVVVRNHFFCEIGASTSTFFGLKKSIHLHIYMTLFLNIGRSFMYVWKQFEILFK